MMKITNYLFGQNEVKNMVFKEAELSKEDWDSCIDKDEILDIGKYCRIEHKRALEQGLTNIEDFDEYLNLKTTLSRPWM